MLLDGTLHSCKRLTRDDHVSFPKEHTHSWAGSTGYISRLKVNEIGTVSRIHEYIADQFSLGKTMSRDESLASVGTTRKYLIPA
jgi:hypothetical protein